MAVNEKRRPHWFSSRRFSNFSLHKLFILDTNSKSTRLIHANWLRPCALGILSNFFQSRSLIGGICWTSWRWMHPASKFVIIVRQEIGESVRYLPDQKTFFSAPCQTVATARIAPKVCHGQPPTFGWQLSKFRPNRFTFSGGIAGRVKAIQNAPPP